MKYSFSDMSNVDALSFWKLINNEVFYMQDCDVRIFYIFKSLYDSGSATFVSQQHSVSPSKVSRYIAEMREVYNDSLFIRRKTHFVPTKKAREIYPKICEIIGMIENLSANRHEIEVKKECVIAVPATLCVGLPEHLNRIIKQEGWDISLNVISSHREICTKVINGEICIAITNRACTQTMDCNPKYSNLLHVEPISVGEHVYVVSAATSAIWQESISLDNIAKYPFVVTQVSGFNDEKDPFEVYCELRGLALNVFLKTQNLASMIEALMSENTISFIGPNSAADFIAKVPSLRVEKLANCEYQRLHEAMHKPTYSMIYLKRNVDVIPSLIKSEVLRFISDSVCEI